MFLTIMILKSFIELSLMFVVGRFILGLLAGAKRQTYVLTTDPLINSPLTASIRASSSPASTAVRKTSSVVITPAMFSVSMAFLPSTTSSGSELTTAKQRLRTFVLATQFVSIPQISLVQPFSPHVNQFPPRHGTTNRSGTNGRGAGWRSRNRCL